MADIRFVELRLGFHARGTDDFVATWTAADRRALRQMAEADVQETVPAEYLARWTGLTITADGNGNIGEAQLQQCIQDEMDAFNADPDTDYELQFSTSSTQLGAGYVWIGNVRYCLHEYGIEWKDKGAPDSDYGDWVVEHTPNGGTTYQAVMYAQLTWPTSL